MEIQWVFLIIGLFVGAAIGIVGIALLVSASKADKEYELMRGGEKP